MSKKPKAPTVKPSYFGESRDYAKVVAAEFAFFKGLVAAKNDISSIQRNQSLQAALKEVTPFLQDQGRPLNIIVQFSVTDPRSNASHTLLLGTRLQPPQPQSHPQVTHFLCLADAESFLAKVHADFDFHPEATEKKPSPHVQMGGGVSGPLLKCHQHSQPSVRWDEGMSKPRLPSLPICTALLWHWAFLEYRDNEQILGFLTAWHWNELVKKAESTVLGPYFKDGIEMIKEHPDKGLLNALYVPVIK